MKDDYKTLQERYTQIDTIKHQRKLLELIEEKIRGEPYFNKEEDRLDFFELVGKAFLSAGTLSEANRRKFTNPGYPIRRKDGTCAVVIPLGRDVHHFAISLLMELRSEKVTVSMREKKYVLDSRELWKNFKGYCKEIFPLAQAEALHASVERMTKGESTTGYGIGDD